MDNGSRMKRQGGYITSRQRKKLIGLVTQHPEIITCKVADGFTYKDAQKLWESITNECNSLPGARKTWRQWKKTFQDIRSHAKKRQAEINGEVPPIAITLTPAEQGTLGLKNVSSTTNCQERTEFVTLGHDNSLDFNNKQEFAASCNEPNSPQEVKVFEKIKTRKKFTMKRNSKCDSKTSHKCNFNCDMIAVSEQKMLKEKEGYLNFKKEYLKEKLKCVKEQTEALKVIATEMSRDSGFVNIDIELNSVQKENHS